LYYGLFLSNAIAQSTDYVPNQIIVKYKRTAVRTTSRPNLAQGWNAIQITQLADRQSELWQFPTTQAFDSTLQALQQNPNIAYAEPNYLFQLSHIPDDPLYNTQWALEDISAPAAWDIFTGDSTILTAVIDGELDWTHPDLLPNIWQNLGEDVDGDGHVLEYINGRWEFDPGDINNTDDDGNGFDDDFIGWDFVEGDNDPREPQGLGHATHVMGTIAARGDNRIGVAGINWYGKVMAIRAFQGAHGRSDHICEAIAYATTNQAHIINNSWGGTKYSQSLYDKVQATHHAGQLFVAAAGNRNSNNDIHPFYPANYDLPNILSVASTTPQENKAISSGYGVNSVDIAAPGQGIFSTLPNNQYEGKSGTSMATPHVSGTASLLWSKYPFMTHLQVREHLLCTTDILPSLTSVCGSGGKLNAAHALQMTPNPTSTFQQSMGGSAEEQAASILTTSDGRYLLAGSTLSFGSGNWDVCLNKLDAGGNILSSYTYGGADNEHAYDIIETSTNHYITVGLVDGIRPSIWVMKSTETGTVVWTKHIQAGIECLAHTVVESADGNYILIGNIQDSISQDIYVLKLNAFTGNVLWATQLGGLGTEVGRDIVQTPNNEYIIAGEISPSGSNQWDVYLAKIDDSGNILWKNRYGTSNQNEKAYALMRTQAHDYALTGEQGNLFDRNLLGIQFDDQGDIIWSRTWQPDSIRSGVGYDLLGTADGGYLFVGEAYIPHPQAYLIRTNEQGQTLWSKTLEGEALSWGRSITPSLSIGYVIAGNTTQIHGNPKDFYLINTGFNSTIGCNEHIANSLTDSLSATLNPIISPDITLSIDSAYTISLNPIPASPESSILCVNPPCSDLNATGCQVFASFEAQQVMCLGDTALCVSQSINNSNFNWSSNNVTYPQIQGDIFEFVPEIPGSWEIRLIASDTDCNDTATQYILVQPPPLLTFPDTINECANAIALDMPLLGGSYLWSDIMGDTLSTLPLHIFDSSDTYIAHISDLCGAATTDTFTVILETDTTGGFCVWPGDINLDGLVNMADYLWLAIAYDTLSTTGCGYDTLAPWSSYSNCPNFARNIPGLSFDKKHADCNGDGRLDMSSDASIIAKYFADSTITSNFSSANNAATFSIDFPQTVSFLNSDTVVIPFTIDLQDSLDVPLYGFAASISYDLTLAGDPILTTDNSWLGTEGFDLVNYHIHQPEKQRLHIGFTRFKNRHGKRGRGKLGGGCLIITLDDISNDSLRAVIVGDNAYLTLVMENLIAYDSAGNSLPINSNTVTATTTLPIHLPPCAMEVPNPSGSCSRDAFEPNNSLLTASPLPLLGINNNAQICDSADEDWFYINILPHKPNLKITLTNLPTDLNLELYNNQGVLIGQSREICQNDEALIKNGLAPNQPYYIRILGRTPNHWDPNNGYNLRVQTRTTPFNQ